MKRTFVTVALALMALPALALEVGPPFDQNQIDRQLPDIDFPPVEPYVADGRAPYDQLAIDRALPNIADSNRPQFAIPDDQLPYDQLTVDRALPDIYFPDATRLAEPVDVDRSTAGGTGRDIN